ncbi:TonB-dependent receptor [bacterium]|nr:MAG: TonB-dependent receptor [bacterium]
MKRSVFIPILLFSLSIAASAFEVRGTVVTPGGKPIEGAIVLHRSSGAQALSDSGGAFTLDVPDEGRVRLEVIHPDYYEQAFAFTKKTAARGVTLILAPLISQNEEVVVTALRYPEASANVPAAGTVIGNAVLTEEMAPNITEGLASTPGVSALGSGGFSLVPSIRGLARRRVLYLVDNARLSSERRTGPNASFINPEDIDRIEVLRSSASVLYGSDAIGGVIHILTKGPNLEEGLKGRLLTRYGTVNDEKGAGLSLRGSEGSTGFYLSFQGLDAGNYSSPSGKVLQSQYTQGSLLGKIVHRTDKREVTAAFLGARGKDIGKPNRNSLTKPTWYPKEDQNLFQLRWVEKEVAGGQLSFQAYADPNSLETRTDSIDGYKIKSSTSKARSTEYGFQLSYGKKIGGSFRLEGGADLFGQAGGGARNVDTSFGPDGNIKKVGEELPYTRGKRTDVGVFISGDYSGIRNLDLLGGLRWDHLVMQAAPGDGKLVRTDNDKLTGFLAASFKLAERFVAFANLSRSYRVPSLNERFYTGISGRGFIIAQPGLRPETALNLDGGVRYTGRRLFAGLYAFSYTIDDMIERYTKSPSIYTYGNIDKGWIRGLEFEVEYFPVPGWKIFGNLFSIKGRSVKTDASLNDIPSFHAYAGTRVWLGRFSAEINGTFQLKKNDPGPAEVAIPGSGLVNFKTNYILSSSLSFFGLVSNLFDNAYFARPDSEAMLEPGRSLNVGVAFSF